MSKVLAKALKTLEEMELRVKLFLNKIFAKSYEDFFIGERVK